MPYIYQAPGCREYRKREVELTCSDPRCEACYGEKALRLLCASGAGGPFACRLERNHPGSEHVSVVTWNASVIDL